jgi:hypothetical protein
MFYDRNDYDDSLLYYDLQQFMLWNTDDGGCF